MCVCMGVHARACMRAHTCACAVCARAACLRVCLCMLFAFASDVVTRGLHCDAFRCASDQLRVPARSIGGRWEPQDMPAMLKANQLFFSSPSPRCSCHTNTAYGASPCGSSFLCMVLGANWHLLGFMIFVYLCLLLFFLVEAFIKFRQWIKFRKEQKQRQKGQEGSKAQLQEGAEGLWQSSLVLCCYFILLMVHEVYPCSYIAITAAVAVCEPFRRSTSTQDCERQSLCRRVGFEYNIYIT